MRAEPAEKRELIGLLGQNLFLEGRRNKHFTNHSVIWLHVMNELRKLYA